MTKATSKNEPIEELDIATVDPMAKKTGKEFPGWLYGVLFVLFDAVGVAALQIGVSESATRVAAIEQHVAHRLGIRRQDVHQRSISWRC